MCFLPRSSFKDLVNALLEIFTDATLHEADLSSGFR